MGMRNGVEDTDHFASARGILDYEIQVSQFHGHYFDDPVEGGCGAALLLELDKAQVCLATMLENGIELGAECNLANVQDY